MGTSDHPYPGEVEPSPRSGRSGRPGRSGDRAHEQAATGDLETAVAAGRASAQTAGEAAVGTVIYPASEAQLSSFEHGDSPDASAPSPAEVPSGAAAPTDGDVEFHAFGGMEPSAVTDEAWPAAWPKSPQAATGEAAEAAVTTGQGEEGEAAAGVDGHAEQGREPDTTNQQAEEGANVAQGSEDKPLGPLPTPADQLRRAQGGTAEMVPVENIGDPTSWVPGAELNHVKRYEVLGCIGEGGMGWVFRAYDPVLERDVALKVMKPDVPEHQRRRFRQEALYGARFSYPGIARVYDLVDDPNFGEPWFAMEYLSGKDLSVILEHAQTSDRTIPLRLIQDVFRQVLGALGYSHECKVVHRDVKPANMFVTRDPNTRLVTTKLLDFGVALDLSDREREAGETQLVGDPRYMPPEQTRLGAPVDHRADLYSAGMCLYELVIGRHAFEDLLDAPTHEMVAAHRERAPIPMSNFMPPDTNVDLACGLDIVFERACAKDPEARFESAHEMQVALNEVLEQFAAIEGRPDQI